MLKRVISNPDLPKATAAYLQRPVRTLKLRKPAKVKANPAGLEVTTIARGIVLLTKPRRRKPA